MKNTVLQCFVCLFVVSVWGRASAATTFFSNLGQTSDGIGWGQYGGPVDINASDFLTGASATTITGATFSFSNWDDIAHVMTPKIFTDNGGLPGTLVGTFSTFNIAPDILGPGSGTFRDYTVTSDGINLAANTKYWMAVSVDTATDLPFPVLWNTTASNSMDGASTFSEVTATKLKYSNDGGSSWIEPTASTANAMFSLSGNPQAAPEPSRVILLFSGLGLMILNRRRDQAPVL